MILRKRERQCREVRRIVQAFLDGELPPDKTAQVADHLDRCQACGVDAKAIEDVKHALGDLRTPVDPAGPARIMRKFGAEPS